MPESFPRPRVILLEPDPGRARATRVVLEAVGCEVLEPEPVRFSDVLRALHVPLAPSLNHSAACGAHDGRACDCRGGYQPAAALPTRNPPKGGSGVRFLSPGTLPRPGSVVVPAQAAPAPRRPVRGPA